MNPIESVQTCLTKFADFNGTASRPEYWWFVLTQMLASSVLSVISPLLSYLFCLALLVPSLAAGARRLHETGRTGWWQLLWFVPFFGWIACIVLLALPPRTATRSSPAMG